MVLPTARDCKVLALFFLFLGLFDKNERFVFFNAIFLGSRHINAVGCFETPHSLLATCSYAHMFTCPHAYMPTSDDPKAIFSYDVSVRQYNHP